MGRKTRRPVRTRPKPSLPIIFECPRCEATAIQIDLKDNVATINCGNCHLSDAIADLPKIAEKVDVYGDFLDRYYASLTSLGVSGSPAVDKGTLEAAEAAGLSVDSPTQSFDAGTEAGLVDQEVQSEEEEELGAEETEPTEPEENEEEEQPSIGFFPKPKSEVLKKSDKSKKKDKKVKRFSL